MMIGVPIVSMHEYIVDLDLIECGLFRWVLVDRFWADETRAHRAKETKEEMTTADVPASIICVGGTFH